MSLWLQVHSTTFSIFMSDWVSYLQSRRIISKPSADAALWLSFETKIKLINSVIYHKRLVKDFSSDCSVHYSRENPHFESAKENIKTVLRPNVWALYGIVSKWEGLPSFEVWNLLHGFHVPDFIWEKCRTLRYKTILLFHSEKRRTKQNSPKSREVSNFLVVAL